MAKGKHAAALFEVISKSRGMRNQSEQKVLATPRWWFQRRSNTPNTTKPTPNPDRPLVSAVIAPPPPEAHSATFHEPPVPHESASSSLAGRPRPLALRVDPEQKQISLKLSFTSAMIGAMSIVALVGIAVLIGEHLNQRTNLVLSGQRSADLKAGPAYPGVMNVPAHGLAVTPIDAVSDNTPRQPTPALHASVNSPQLPATATVDSPSRVIGMNYLIVQSYPNKKDADEACDCLNQQGVPCTVEKSLKRWNDWYAVVTLKGFSRISNSPELDTLKVQVMDVSAKFAGKKKFRAFDPAPYRWMEAR